MSDPISWSRADPTTLVPAARALMGQGRTRSEVLEAIYGVDLPRETILFQRDFVGGEKSLGIGWRVLPWELMIPIDEGGPEATIGKRELAEDVRLYERVPNVVLVGSIHYSGTPLGSSLVGYDLDEVRAGRSTVVGLRNVPRLPDPVPDFAVLGPSLAEVMDEAVRAYLALTEARRKLDRHEDIDLIEEHVANVAALRRELG